MGQAGSRSAGQQGVVIATAMIQDLGWGGGMGEWVGVLGCMVGQGKSKPMWISQPPEGRTDKSDGPGTRWDKHPRQNTAESRGKAQISNLDMRG